MKKIILGLILGIFVLGFVASTMSGMVVSVSEEEQKSFSFQEKSYSVEIQEQDDGTIDLEVNGEKVENIEEGDVVVVNGAEVEVTDVKEPWFFRNEHKIKLQVKEGMQTTSTQPIEPEEEPTCSGTSGFVEEGETLSLSGHQIQISYLASEETILIVDGEVMPKISEGESLVLDNGDSLMVMDIMYGLLPSGQSSGVQICITAASSSPEVTYQGVLNMLNSCHVNSQLTSVIVNPTLTGNEHCGESYTCVGTFLSDVPNTNNSSYDLTNTYRVKCSDFYEGPETSYYIQSICCSVPL